MIEIPRTFYIYNRNNLPNINSPTPVAGSSLDDINDPMLEMCTIFDSENVTIEGEFETPVSIDTFCIGNTNATSFELNIGKKPIQGNINSLITVRNFKDSIFIDKFTLMLSGPDPIYLGHLFFGEKTCLPRFSVEPNTSIELRSEGSRSFGGQAFGMRRKPLMNFSVNFPWLTSEEREILIDYLQDVQNVEPHIIDPYPQARDQFPPMYVTVDAGDVSLPKLNENGFFYSGSLSWKEAR